MSGNADDDFTPVTTPGYKPTAVKSIDEYAQLDAQDESLARWKASLGVVPGVASSNTSGPKITLLEIRLLSPTLPPSKSLVMDLQNPAALQDWLKQPINIKEGVEYNVQMSFKVNHSIVTGLRYQQVVKHVGLKVDTLNQMLGSYGPEPSGKPYVKDFDKDEMPSGMLVRKGTYYVRSRVTDDDEVVYLDWQWAFKLSKDW